MAAAKPARHGPNKDGLGALGRSNARSGAAMRQVWLSVGDYALNVGVLAAFAWLQIVPYSVPLLIGAYALAANLVYLGLIYSGFSARFRDPYLTRLGVALGVLANLIALMLAPQIAYLFIINLFVPLAFAALRFSRAEFLAAGAMLVLVLGAMLGFGLTALPLGMLKGFDPGERFVGWIVVSLAITRFLVIQSEIARLGNRLREKNEALRAASVRLARQASHDDLTGLTNRREFMRILQHEISRARRGGNAFCVVLLDIDHFKRVNDRFGHAVGDQVLVTAARIYRRSVRQIDVCARYGGEEFTVLAPDSTAAGMRTMIERMRSNIESHDWSAIAPGLRVTVSAGIACWMGDSDSDTEILRRADDAMYQAKAAGRNCVWVSD